MGDSKSYRICFIPLPRRDGKSEQGVMLDRPFSTRETLNSYAGFSRIGAITYDPADNPGEMLISYPMFTDDLRPLPPQRTQVRSRSR